jgi:hypothetical protein
LEGAHNHKWAAGAPATPLINSCQKTSYGAYNIDIRGENVQTIEGVISALIYAAAFSDTLEAVKQIT